MIEGIILAGGFSSRANQNKMLFDFGGHPLIWHTIESLRPFVDRIIVVTGHYDSEIREALKNEKEIEFVYNKQYPMGMFSSVKTGVEITKSDFLILPGDCPFIPKKVISKILAGNGAIRYPRYKEKDGHPLYVSKLLKKALLDEPDDSNLKLFRDKQNCEVIQIDDENVLNDIDTQNDYNQKLMERN